jgi:glycosyltransferase involved in cell wall biosynthesis
VTVHDVIHLLPDLFPAPRVKRLASHYTFAKIRRQADLVLFDSRFTRDEFHRLVGRPENGIVVQLGGDHMNRGRSPIVAKEKSLLVVAAFKKHKNFATVLDAWRRAQVAGHWRLTIIAPDEKLRSSVDVEAMTAGIHGVDLRRSVSDAELHDIYGRTAILLAPSLYEGFGLPLLEAFSAGAFAISSTAGSLVEIADGAEAAMVNGSDIDGWVAAIERTCARFDDHDFDALGIARRNMAHAASFRWSDTASGTAAALRGLLDPIPSPSDTGFPSDHV